MKKAKQILALLMSVIMVFSPFAAIDITSFAYDRDTNSLEMYLDNDNLAVLSETLITALDDRKEDIVPTALNLAFLYIDELKVQAEASGVNVATADTETLADVLIAYIDKYLAETDLNGRMSDYSGLFKSIFGGVAFDLNSVDGILCTLVDTFAFIHGSSSSTWGDLYSMDVSSLETRRGTAISTSDSLSVDIICSVISFLDENIDIVKKIIKSDFSIGSSNGILQSFLGIDIEDEINNTMKNIDVYVNEYIYNTYIAVGGTLFEDSPYASCSSDEIAATALIKQLCGEEIDRETASEMVSEYSVYQIISEYFADYLNTTVKDFLYELAYSNENFAVLKEIINFDYEFSDSDLSADIIFDEEYLNDAVCSVIEVIVQPSVARDLALKYGGNENIEANFTSIFGYILDIIASYFNTSVPADIDSFNEIILYAVYLIAGNSDFSELIFNADGSVKSFTVDTWIDAVGTMLAETAVKNIGMTQTEIAELKATGWTWEDFLEELVDRSLNYVSGIPAVADSLSIEGGVSDGYGAWYKLNVVLNELIPFNFMNDCGDETFVLDTYTLVVEKLGTCIFECDFAELSNVFALNTDMDNILNQPFISGVLGVADNFVVSLLEHNCDETESFTKAATATENGYEGTYCKSNGHYINVTVTPATGETASPDEPEYVLGDVDSDGYTTSADARTALRIAAGLELIDNHLALCDIDDNGKTTASDSRRILRASAMLETIENQMPVRERLDVERSNDVSINMTVSSDSIEVGNTFEMVVSGTNVGGLENANLFFEYNSEYLEFVDVYRLNDDVAPDTISGGSVAEGKASLGLIYRDANTQNDADLAVITFKALKSGESSVACTVGTWDGTAVPEDTSISVTAAEPHIHDYTAVITSPTCVEQGYTTYTCSCGDSYISDYVEATNEHNYEAVVTSPTCTEEGYTTYTCSCGDSYITDYIEAHHSFVDGSEYCSLCGSYFLYYEIRNGEVNITGCDSSYVGNVVIPETIEGYPVTAVGAGDIGVFFDCENITSIRIPTGVKEIGDISINNTLCVKLEKIIVDENNPYYSSDEYGVLYNKDKTELVRFPMGSKLIAYEVPDNVTSIASNAFSFCENLENIVLPSTLTAIGSGVFDGTPYYTDSSNWNNGVLRYGNYLICVGCQVYAEYDENMYYNQTSFNVDADITVIAENAFLACDGLAEIKEIIVDENNQYYSSDEYGVLFNKDKTVLIQYPFFNERTAYTIPDGVVTIGDSAFYCARINKVDIPNTVTTIEDSAFYMSGLESVDIPDSVTTLGEWAFCFCDNLKTAKLSKNLTEISDCAFRYCGELNVEIPDGITTIGGYAFAFKSDGIIIIPDSVNYIEFMGITADVYYEGSEEDWKKIESDNDWLFDDVYSGAYTVYYNYVSDNKLNELLPKTDSAITVDNNVKTATITDNSDVSAVLAQLENEDVKILDSKGNELAADKLVGTGCVIKCGENEYTVIVPCDVDGNGRIAAADARLALRSSAKLDVLDGVYATAANADGNEKITASDARKILRKSAKLE